MQWFWFLHQVIDPIWYLSSIAVTWLFLNGMKKNVSGCSAVAEGVTIYAAENLSFVRLYLQGVNKGGSKGGGCLSLLVPVKRKSFLNSLLRDSKSSESPLTPPPSMLLFLWWMTVEEQIDAAAAAADCLENVAVTDFLPAVEVLAATGFLAK